MKKILISYPAMMLGGSTTSLLSILYHLNYDKYDVDLILDWNYGEWINDIPLNIHILKPAYIYQNPKSRMIHRLLSPRFMYTKICASIISRYYKSYQVGQQYLEMKDADFYRDVETEYDVAIAFLEGRQCKYIAKHVKAKRKIAWIHIDYKASEFLPKFDVESMGKFDRIVTVSEQCLKSFRELFPQFAEKCVYIENILSKKRLENLARIPNNDFKINEESLKFITTCRISFSAKGLDRAVRVFARLKNDNTELFKGLQWYIIGSGNDEDALRKLIEENDLSKNIHMLGMKINPYPYVKKMDLFFLPSIWEGKPMAVTEAQILGLPALVTHYSSAYEQIRDGVDGMVVDNSEEGIYQGLKYILEHPEKIAEWKLNVLSHDYSNTEEIKKVEGVIDGTI